MAKGEQKTVSNQPAENKTQQKSKAINKAKQVAKTGKKGQHLKRKHTIRTKVRFYRPKTLILARNGKYARRTKQLIPADKGIDGFDKFSVIKYPLNTEKAMKKIEDENTIVFVVDSSATKPAIKDAFYKIYNTKVRSVNTVNR